MYVSFTHVTAPRTESVTYSLGSNPGLCWPFGPYLRSPRAPNLGLPPRFAGEIVHEVQPTGITTRIPFLDQSGCSGSFVYHDLDNVSLIPGDQGVRMFDSNGSGVALGDLNGDLLPEITFANLSEPNAILWNLGDSSFNRTALSHQDSRAAAMVDVDGDGALDIVFTRRLDPPVAYLSNVNTTGGAARFSISILPGIAKTAYSMAWVDVDRDGDLDLLTGSYDLELKALLEEAFEGQTNSGVYWHEQRASQFQSHLLALHSQALALTVVPSVDGMKLTAGNDFLLPDGTHGYGAKVHGSVDTPFANTTQNTMSFSVGDVNNDGHLDLFAADMKPRVRLIDDIMAAVATCHGQGAGRSHRSADYGKRIAATERGRHLCKSGPGHRRGGDRLDLVYAIGGLQSGRLSGSLRG